MNFCKQRGVDQVIGVRCDTLREDIFSLQIVTILPLFVTAHNYISKSGSLLPSNIKNAQGFSLHCGLYSYLHHASNIIKLLSYIKGGNLAAN